MSNKKQCNFEPSSQTSSSTICKWCGKEKWQHILLMSNKKQTAVEWLIKQLTEAERNLINKTYLQNDKSLAGYRLRELFNQAKELEKQQIIDACYFAYNEGCSYMTDGKTEYESFEQYYTETYEN